MTRRSSSPKKPYERTKATRERAVTSTIAPEVTWADRIWDLLLKGTHPFQHDVVTDPSRRYSMLVGRGGAKTTSFRVRAIRTMTSKARAKVLYFASTRGRAKDLMWSPLKALLPKLGLQSGRDVIFNETELRCTITATGSTLQLSGLKDISDGDKWRGDTFDEVQIDECGAIKPDLVQYLVFEVIGPRVHVIGLGGTPGRDRRKLFYERTRPGSVAADGKTPMHVPFARRDEYPDYSGYSSHHWTLEDVTKLPDAETKYPELCRLWREALIEKRDNGWSDDNPIWLREYKAVWAADNTLRVFYQFQPHRDGAPWNVWDPFDGGDVIPGVAGLRIAIKRLHETFTEFKDWRYVVPMDMGHKDPFACSVFGFSPHDTLRRKWQLMDFEKVGMHAKPIAELLIGAEEVDTFIKTGVFPSKKYGGVFGAIGGWPDGMVFDSDHATLEELKNVYGIQIEKADKKPEYKGGAIELVNGEFTDQRFFVLRGSSMHEQLEQLQWKELDNGRLIEDPAQANHSSDLSVYGLRKVANMFESGQVAQDDRVSPQTFQDPMGLGPPQAPDAGDEEDQSLLVPMEWTDDDEWG